MVCGQEKFRVPTESDEISTAPGDREQNLSRERPDAGNPHVVCGDGKQPPRLPENSKAKKLIFHILSCKLDSKRASCHAQTRAGLQKDCSIIFVFQKQKSDIITAILRSDSKEIRMRLPTITPAIRF
jgi:hypothetical protein